MFAVPMYDSEEGDCGAIVGYAGPFSTVKQSIAFQHAHNSYYRRTNEYYVAAQDPVLHSPDVKCTYDTIVAGIDYSQICDRPGEDVIVPSETLNYQPPYNRLYIDNKMGVILGKGMSWYTSEEHCNQRYSIDRDLVAALVTNDPVSFQKAYEALCGQYYSWIPKNFDKLTVAWVPRGFKFCICWDAVSKSEKIQEYVECEWIVAE